MYLKRKIDEYLLEWKEKEERLPLIIIMKISANLSAEH